MSLISLLLTASALSMDAFAVSVCKGLKMKKTDIRQIFLTALFFGGFQAMMPVAGWIAGRSFEKYITAFDHWVAFFLLLYTGGKMIAESFRADNEKISEGNDIRELILLAFATSIDALAVGITFAFLSINIIFAAAVIGVITFVLSAAGAAAGKKLGSGFGNKAENAGGIILVLTGLKILLEHLGIISV